MRYSRAALIAALAGGLIALSCSHKASDDALANSIKASLFSDPTTKSENITVAAKDGVITLGGDVASADAALAAMKIANGTAGVKSVSDQLTINGAAAATQLPNAGSPQTAGAPPPAESSPTPSAAGGTPAPAPAASVPTNTAPPTPVAEAAPPPPPQPVVVTIPTQQVSVRTIDAIDSKVNQSGQTFRAVLTSPLVAHGRVIIPTGSDATILLTNAKSAGKVKGKAELEVELAGVRFHGREYAVESSPVTTEGKSRGKQTTVRTGIGAAAGALIGGLAGGGKGAAIGAAAGGGAGFGSSFFTKGPKVQIPAETQLTFQLGAPVSVQVEH